MIAMSSSAVTVTPAELDEVCGSSDDCRTEPDAVARLDTVKRRVRAMQQHLTRLWLGPLIAYDRARGGGLGGADPGKSARSDIAVTVAPFREVADVVELHLHEVVVGEACQRAVGDGLEQA